MTDDPPREKRDVRVTVCLGRWTAEKVAAAAAEAGMSKSEWIAAVVATALPDWEALPSETIVEESWRDRRGL